MADTAVAAAAEKQQQNGGPSRAQRLKQKRKERKKAKKENVNAEGNKRAKLNEGDTPSSVKVKEEPQSETSQQLPPGVEIEYVAPNPLDELEKDDPMYQEFAAIFARFSGASEDEATADVEMADEPAEDVKPDLGASAASSAMSGDSDDEDGSQRGSKLSKKKQRQLRRLNIAALKQIVKRPDLVEIHDCSAPDPLFAIHLKGYRNSISIPRHWSQRRKYLQGKRGIEKVPFELPDFVKATGIADIRAAVLEKEAAQKLKSKQRERLQPKMGKLDIDYRVLYNAFFRYQTKPKMTFLGDLYYEGKEFEVKLKEKTPGVLSAELKAALGMPEGYPPPWLLMQQRVGPPPAYPKLRIPGVNAPIPPGAQWGGHPGGWGRAPVDEMGRPIWGWVEELPPDPDQLAFDKSFRWGVLPDVDDEEEEEEEQAEPDLMDGAEPEKEEEQQAVDEPDLNGGIESVPGIETPAEIELRKFRPQEPQQLYQVVPAQAAAIGGAIYGSEFMYQVPPTAAPTGPATSKKSDNAAVNIIRSQRTAAIDVAVAPEDLDLPEEELRKKYANIIDAKEKEKNMPLVTRVQDMPKDKDDKKKKKKDFKF